MIRVSNPGEEKYFSLLENVQTRSGAHPTYYSERSGVLYRGQNDGGVTLITHLNLVPRLRMIGAIPLLPLHAFMAWTGKKIDFFFIFTNGKMNSEKTGIKYFVN
jgi:hypothetical protein